MKIDDQTWDFVCKTLIDLQRQMDTHDAAMNAIRLPPESPLVEPFWWALQAVTDSLWRMVGVSGYNDISWFVHECDFGRKDMQAEMSNGESRVIKTLDDLRWLIED